MTVSYSLEQVVVDGFEQAPLMQAGALIPDVQAAGMRGDGRPDIFAGPPLADTPGFVEQCDSAIGSDPPNEMHAASRDRQLFWKLGGLPFG